MKRLVRFWCAIVSTGVCGVMIPPLACRAMADVECLEYGDFMRHEEWISFDNPGFQEITRIAPLGNLLLVHRSPRTFFLLDPEAEVGARVIGGHDLDHDLDWWSGLVLGKHVFVEELSDAGDDSIAVYDVSDFEHWILRSRLPYEGIQGFALHRDFLYLLTNDALRVYDVRNPAHPIWIRDVAVANPGAILAVDSYAYVGARQGGRFQTLDLQDPAHPRVVHEQYLRDRHRRLLRDGDRLYVVHDLGVHVLNLASPGLPAPMGSIQLPYRIVGRSVELREHDLIVPEHRRTYALNVTEIDAPRELGSIWHWGDSSYGQLVHGDRVYSLRFGMIWPIGALEISELVKHQEPPEFSRFNLGEASDVIVDGNLAYVIDGGSRIHVVELSVPEIPRSVATVDLPRDVVDWLLLDKHLYVIDGTRRLAVVDVREPKAPRLTEGQWLESPVRQVAGSGHHLLVRQSNHEIGVVDIEVPTEPRFLTSWTPPCDPRAIEIVSDLLYLGCGDEGLSIVDVSDPLIPRVVGFSTDALPWEPLAVELGVLVANELGDIGGDWISWAPRVVVVDVSDPTRPRTMSRIVMPNLVNHLSLDATGLLLACHVDVSLSYQGVDLIDLRDTSRPVRVGRVDDPLSSERSLAAETSGRHVLVVDAGVGLRVFSRPCWDAKAAPASSVAVDHAARVVRARVSPHPARGPVAIALDAREPASVRVAIFDVGGRRVRDLGAHAIDDEVLVIWDGNDDGGRPTPTGVYFARVTAPGSPDSDAVVRFQRFR